MPTAPDVPAEDWNGDKIRRLRKSLGMDPVAFGYEIYDYASDGSARVAVSRLENDEMNPSAAVRRTLYRLESQAEKQSSK